jgi:hypothetical protein
MAVWVEKKKQPNNSVVVVHVYNLSTLKMRLEDHEFDIILGYSVSSRPDVAI